MERFWQRVEAYLYTPVDGASLAVFRIAFGLMMLWDVTKYLAHDLVGFMYIQPRFHFTYYGFEWVEPLPGGWMYLVFAVMGLLGFLITIGLFYRVAITLFLVLFSYIFLLDQTEYLNHFYFVILLNILLVFVPANRVYALDALLWPRKTEDSHKVYAWNVWIVRVQMEIMLVFAGIVKINPDWLALQPLSMWLAQSQDLPLVGPLLMESWVIAIGAYGVILLHVAGAPLLLWKRTRLPVFMLYVLFHLSNAVFFNIGIFPWLTIAGTTIFFAADWPRRWVGWGQRTLQRVLPANLEQAR